MDKWEGLKKQLEKIGRTEKIYTGHIIMMMNQLENNPNWDLEKDEWIFDDE